MINHVYPDGSIGHEYEIGDAVTVLRTIQGGWFDIGPVGSDECVVVKVDERAPPFIRRLEVRHSSEWGPAHCFPWMVEPKCEARQEIYL